MIDLGIFVVTLKRRRPFFARLMRRLEPQLNARVAIYTLEDEGRETIGAKRQRMLEESPDCRLVCFVDDDDLVAPTYCADILDAMDGKAVGPEGIACEDPDVVGFRLNYFEESRGKFELRGKSYHSLVANPYKGWKSVRTSTRPHELIHYRTPNHLNPVRMDWAREIGFKPLQSGEDADFSQRLKESYPHMREAFIDKVEYEYLYRHPHRRKEGEEVKVEDVVGL